MDTLYTQINNGYEILPTTGIEILTGESDNTNMGRLLCDINQTGLDLIQSYLGIESLKVYPNWNSDSSRVRGKIGSILITRAIISDLIKFHLILTYAHILEVQDYMDSYGFYLCFETEDDFKHYTESDEYERLFSYEYDEKFNFIPKGVFSAHYKSYRGNKDVELRNTHTMSGRTY